MRELKLSNGFIVFVDDEDYEWLSQYKWQIGKRRHTCYVYRNGRTINGVKQHSPYMHREIMSKYHDVGYMDVDHIDNNGLNNCKNNLRLCTRTQNHGNRRVQTGFTSKYKGVGWHKTTNRWRAYIQINGKYVHLGMFNDERLAALAYNNAAINHFGEFAKLNDV